MVDSTESVREYSPIEPEPDVQHVEGYTSDHWDYPKRCANLDLAMANARERVEEWDKMADPHGWWHERPMLIALYNEVARLREGLQYIAEPDALLDANEEVFNEHAARWMQEQAKYLLDAG